MSSANSNKTQKQIDFNQIFKKKYLSCVTCGKFHFVRDRSRKNGEVLTPIVPIQPFNIDRSLTPIFQGHFMGPVQIEEFYQVVQVDTYY